MFSSKAKKGAFPNDVKRRREDPSINQASDKNRAESLILISIEEMALY
jgi:hypothetical protein